MQKQNMPSTVFSGLRVAGYIRVSTQRQAVEGDSLEAQENEIKKSIEYKKDIQQWNVGSIEFYRDAGKSAKDQNRPELKRLISDIESGQVNVVICSKLDRLTRSLLDFAHLWELLRKHKVILLSLREDFDTSNAMGEAMLKLIMVFAELERKLTGERTIAAMKDRVDRGLWNGGVVYGYVSNPDNPGELLIDKEWAPIIKTHFFDAFEKLGSVGAVQRRLLELGISQSERKTRSGQVRGGKPFSKQQVARILRNQLYIGSIAWGEATKKNCHQPIISSEQFDLVQMKLNQTTKTRSNFTYSRGRQYLLRGLIRCRCGAMLTPKGATGRNRTHHYYECTRRIHQGGKVACDAPRIPAEALEDAVISRIRHLGLRKEERDRIVKEALLYVDEDARRVSEEIRIVRQQSSQVQTEINNLVQVLKVMGESAVVSVQQELSQLEAKRARLKEHQESLAEQEKPLSVVKSAARTFIESWHSVDELLDEAEPEEHRTILQHLIEVIELKATDENGREGSYAMRLFPEVSQLQTLEGAVVVTEPRALKQAEMLSGAIGENADVLTEDGLVRQNGTKAPRLGLEPRT